MCVCVCVGMSTSRPYIYIHGHAKGQEEDAGVIARLTKAGTDLTQAVVRLDRYDWIPNSEKLGLTDLWT